MIKNAPACNPLRAEALQAKMRATLGKDTSIFPNNGQSPLISRSENRLNGRAKQTLRLLLGEAGFYYDINVTLIT